MTQLLSFCWRTLYRAKKIMRAHGDGQLTQSKTSCIPNLTDSFALGVNKHQGQKNASTQPQHNFFTQKIDKLQTTLKMKNTGTTHYRLKKCYKNSVSPFQKKYSVNLPGTTQNTHGYNSTKIYFLIKFEPPSFLVFFYYY